jgi:hypothetical protein
MDKGKSYRVVYSDGDSTRVKTLKFLNKDGCILVFFNLDKKIEECISEHSFIRSEEII